MKIGIEASRLTEKQRTGTENYLYYLVKSWAKSNHKDEFILYFREEPTRDFWEELTQHNKKFSYKVISSSVSWTQVGLAIELFKNTPDVLFCTWHTMPGINPFWKMKTVSVIHDLTGKFIPTYWTAKFSDKVIAVSRYVEKELTEKYRIKHEKISVIYEGYDDVYGPAEKDEIDKVKSKYNISGDYIFFLSTLGPRKNIENMVEAYLKLDSNIEFVFAGKVMKGYEKILDLPIKYVGRVSNEEAAALYSGAKFLSFVSKEEGFGIPILEAFSCGTPVLTSNTTAAKEVAEDAALLVDPHDVEDIYKGMSKLLSNKTLRKELIDKGFKRTAAFSLEKTAEKVYGEFKAVFKGGGSLIESHKIGGVRVDFGYTQEKVVEIAQRLVKNNKPTFIFTINPEFIMKAKEDESLKETLNQSDLSVPDGVGLLYAQDYLKRISGLNKGFLFPIYSIFVGIWTGFVYGLTKNPRPQRVTGSDLVDPICKMAEKNGYSVMLVGGWQKDKKGKMMSHHGNVAERAGQKLMEKYSKLNIVGATSDFSFKQEDDDKFLEYAKTQLKKSGRDKVDILLSAFTSGGQEKWLHRISEELQVGLCMGVGATFDFMTGDVKRAPQVYKKMNIEWVHRLIKQPWRAKRIYTSVIKFPLFIYRQSLRN